MTAGIVVLADDVSSRVNTLPRVTAISSVLKYSGDTTLRAGDSMKCFGSGIGLPSISRTAVGLRPDQGAIDAKLAVTTPGTALTRDSTSR